MESCWVCVLSVRKQDRHQREAAVRGAGATEDTGGVAPSAILEQYLLPLPLLVFVEDEMYKGTGLLAYCPFLGLTKASNSATTLTNPNPSRTVVTSPWQVKRSPF